MALEKSGFGSDVSQRRKVGENFIEKIFDGCKPFGTKMTVFEHYPASAFHGHSNFLKKYFKNYHVITSTANQKSCKNILTSATVSFLFSSAIWIKSISISPASASTSDVGSTPPDKRSKIGL